MTRTPQWVLDRRPPRKQTPPYEFLVEPCRKCFALTHPADVGPALVHLDTRTYTHGVEGWRWNPPTKSWELTYVTTVPNGHVIYRGHECATGGDAA
jgi:hypothetical protein